MAIIIRSKIAVASKSKYISKLHLVDSAEEGYQILLEKYGSYGENDRPFVLTGDDLLTSYLDTHYDEIKDKFIFYNAGEAGKITYYMDKDNVNDLARRHGLNVARTWRVQRGVIPDSVEFPVITKAISSNSGGWKNDVYICHSEKELTEAYEKIKSEEVLLQKYIYKKNEVCLDGFCVNGGKDLFISMASSYEYILPNEYSTYMYFYPFERQDVITKITEMMTEVGFEGIFTVEFLLTQDDELYFLEINFRNSTWSYASTCLGMNLPLLWSECMLRKSAAMAEHKEIPPGTRAMVEMKDFIVRVIRQKMNPVHWFSECRNCFCLYTYNSVDPKPFWSMIFGHVFKKLNIFNR